MSVALINSRFVGGALKFYEAESYGVISDLLTIAPATITFGSATQDTDVKIFLGAVGQHVVFDVGTATMTLTGVAAALGDLSFAAATDITVAANTIASLEFTNGTTKFFVFDTRNTITGVANVTATGIPATIVAANGVTHNLVSLAPGTTTLTGATGVTAMQGLALTVAQPTITSTSAPAVAIASTVYIAAEPTVGGTATITAAYALYVASGNSMFAGDILAANAAGPAFINEAATTTNPTLCPNRADETTGIGWATSVLHFIIGGTSEVSLSATTMDMNSNTITDSGSFSVTDAAGPIIVNEAATGTNPTLIPNRADETTGIGWATAEVRLVISGGDEYDFTATTLDMNGNTITEAGTIDLDGNLDTSTQASDIIVIANTAAALEVYDGITAIVAVDTRTGITGMANVTITGAPATIASAAGITHQLLALAPGTTILTGTDPVTAMNGLGLSVAQPTITDTGVSTVALASTVYIAAAPVAADAAVITAGYALHVDAGASLFGGDISTVSAAVDFIVIADTDSALEFTDGTTAFVDIDTRVTVTDVANMTITGMPATIVAAGGVTHQLLALVPGTTTLTGATGVNAMNGLALSVAQPTITDGAASTVAVASTVYIAAAPVAADAAVITAAYALHVAAGVSNFGGLIRPAAAGGADSDNALILGIGTSVSPATTSVASANFYETRCQTTAASGAGRGFYLRYDIAPAAGGTNTGEAIRGLLNCNHAIGSATGVSGGFEFDDSNGAISGSATGITGTMCINTSGQSTGGLYGISSCMHFYGAGGPPTHHAILEVRAAGNATGAGKCLNAISFCSTGGEGTGKMIYTHAADPGNAAGSIRILVDEGSGKVAHYLKYWDSE